jgi:voltage-gated potassium channel
MPLPDTNASQRVTALIKYIVIASVIAYFFEVEFVRSHDSISGPCFFLWFERLVALTLTGEYALRIKEAKNKRSYVLSPMGIIDLLSILPFWIGFVVPEEALGYVRTLRVLRLAKFYRYSEGLQNLFAGLKQEAQKLRAVGQVVILTLSFSTALIHMAESGAQPDKFGKLSDCLWWSVVTMTTIGYGDAYPITGVGRIIAMGLIAVGVGIVGAFIGIFGGAMFTQKAQPSYE